MQAKHLREKIEEDFRTFRVCKTGLVKRAHDELVARYGEAVRAYWQRYWSQERAADLAVHAIDLQNRAPSYLWPQDVFWLMPGNVPVVELECLPMLYALDVNVTIAPSRRSSGLLATYVRTCFGNDDRNRIVRVYDPHDLCHDKVLALQSLPKDCAAVIYGHDATVKAVFQHTGLRLAHTACFGHRESVAVINSDTFSCIEAEQLVEDVLLFDNAGCMSPTTVFVSGKRFESAFSDIKEALDDNAIAEYSCKWDVEMQRKAVAEFMDATQPTRSGVFVHVHRAQGGEVPPGCPGVLRIVPIETLYQLGRKLAPIPLQAVYSNFLMQRDFEIVCAPAGASRLANIGTAQLPPWSWPHDGLSDFPLCLFRKFGRG